MKKIRTMSTGKHYVVFGDDQCKYELIEMPDILVSGGYDFEIRVKGSPKDLRALYSIKTETGMSQKAVFEQGIRQGITDLNKRIKDFRRDIPGALDMLAKMEHVRDNLVKLAETF